MNIDSSKPCELDTLVVVYFGQDCDLIVEDCDFNKLLDEYLTTSTEFNLRMLLANIIEIENQSDGYEVLIARYKGEFAPDLWNMTAQEWLSTVKARLISYMIAKGYSTELSHF